MRRVIRDKPVFSNGQFSKEPMQAQSYLVQTVFGNCIVGVNSLVYVKIGKEYVRKLIDEVKKGEEVLFSKDGIPQITIDQVSEALAKSDRYAATQPVLFKQLPDGSYTTAFRYSLLDGLVSKPEGWFGVAPESTRITLSDAANLSDKKVLAAAECIQAKLNEVNVPSVSINHIRYGWLGGKVIAPRNREGVFRALEPIAPELSKLLDSQFNDAYKLYIVIRQTVMHSVSTILKGKVSAKNGEEESEESVAQGISTKPEIKLVVDHFASDVTERYAAGRVLDVKELKRTEETKAREEKGELFRGVVTVEVHDPEIKIKSPIQIMKEQYVLYPIIDRIIYEFLRREIIPTPTLIDGGGRRVCGAEAFLLGCYKVLGMEETAEKQLVKLRRRLEAEGVLLLDEFLPDLRKIEEARVTEKLYAILMHKLQNGELDAIYGFPTGAILKLLDYYLKLRLATPDYVLYKEILENIVNAKENKMRITRQAISTKVERRELDKIKRKYLSEILGSDVTTAIGLCILHSGGEYELTDTIYAGKIKPLEALRQIYDIEKLKSQGLKNDEVALQVLREMGFAHLEFLYPKANELVRSYF